MFRLYIMISIISLCERRILLFRYMYEGNEMRTTNFDCVVAGLFWGSIVAEIGVTIRDVNIGM